MEGKPFQAGSQVWNLGAVGAPPMSPQPTLDLTCCQFQKLASWGCSLVGALNLASSLDGEPVLQDGPSTNGTRQLMRQGETTLRTHREVFLSPREHQPLLSTVVTTCITPSAPGLVPCPSHVPSAPASTICPQTLVPGAAAKGWCSGHSRELQWDLGVRLFY